MSVGVRIPPNYTFCTLILYYLLFASDTWHLEPKKPVTLEIQGLQAKNDPTQSEQLTTVCSDWVGVVQVGTAGGTRTPDLLVRSQTLYPAELQPHLFFTA